MMNAKAVESVIRIGLALNCSIAPWCRFARKNYFYPDMPKNFQTSQYDEPICFDGWTEVEVDGTSYRVEIEMCIRDRFRGGRRDPVRLRLVHLHDDERSRLTVGRRLH